MAESSSKDEGDVNESFCLEDRAARFKNQGGICVANITSIFSFLFFYVSESKQKSRGGAGQGRGEKVFL